MLACVGLCLWLSCCHGVQLRNCTAFKFLRGGGGGAGSADSPVLWNMVGRTARGCLLAGSTSSCRCECLVMCMPCAARCAEAPAEGRLAGVRAPCAWYVAACWQPKPKRSTNIAACAPPPTHRSRRTPGPRSSPSACQQTRSTWCACRGGGWRQGGGGARRLPLLAALLPAAVVCVALAALGQASPVLCDV